MKITMQHRHHQPSPSFAALVRAHLEEIHKTRQIDEARVLVERRLEDSPPFRLSLHLVTPGPDIAVEAVDHTLHAALMKTIDAVESQLAHRARKQTRRLRSLALKPAGRPTFA